MRDRQHVVGICGDRGDWDFSYIKGWAICCCCGKGLNPLPGWAMGGPLVGPVITLFFAEPKLRFEARLAREESRSPVITLVFVLALAGLLAGCSTSPNKLGPPTREPEPVAAGGPKTLLKSAAIPP